MRNFLRFISSPLWGRRSLQPIYALMFRLGIKGLNLGGGAYPHNSGEEFTARYAAAALKHSPVTVFDVGGNKGDYTQLWLKILQENNRTANIYVFEPSSPAAAIISERFAGKSWVHINQFALSDHKAEAILYSDAPGSGLASLANRNLKFVDIRFQPQETVLTQTLDTYCAEENISAIDFLKLDVEGYEHHVLRGAREMLQAKRIRFIQFEFGGTNIDTRIFFKDFFYLLSDHYRIYRVLRDGIWPIANYSELHEIFITTNYLAELK